jgi:hypothetical protein
MVDNGFSRCTPVYFRNLSEHFPGAIQCLNLLHSDPANSESALSRAYSSATSFIQNVSILPFDWHGNVHELGLANAVTSLYSQITPPDLSFSPDSLTFTHVQQNVIRVNCMDSLDRTNVACFYYTALTVSCVLEQLGAGKMLTSYSDIMLLPDAVKTFLADAFTQIGDAVSTMYTNTPACMTEAFAAVAGRISSQRSDGSIAVSRRYHNFVTDLRRQKDISLILGNSLSQILPDVDCSLPLRLVSRYSVEPLVSVDRGAVDGGILLGFERCVVTSPCGVSLCVLLSEYTYLSEIVIVVAPPQPPAFVSVSVALTHGRRVPLISRVALPQVTEPRPVLVRVPADFANGTPFLSRFVRIEFEGCGPIVTLSNVFLYGGKLPASEKTDTFMDFLGHAPEAVREEYAATPAAVVRQIRKLSYKAVVKLETARVFHAMGWLEAAAMLRAHRIDPALFNVVKHRKSCTPSPNCAGCAKCGGDVAWVCFHCSRGCCLQCGAAQPVTELFYYTAPVLLCEECLARYRRFVSKVDRLMAMYAGFYRRFDPGEGGTNDFLAGFLGSAEAGGPLLFPGAFLADADDPADNLVLTRAGGKIAGPKGYSLVLGAPMEVRGVAAFGSEGLRLTLRAADGQRVEIGTDEVACSIVGQFLNLRIGEGELNRLEIQGVPIIPKREREGAGQLRRPQEWVKVPVKAVLAAGKHQIVVDVGVARKLNGVLLRELQGARWVIFAFFVGDWNSPKSRPVATDYYYLPEGEQQFRLLFKPIVPSRYVHMQFGDVAPGFSEPRVELF